MDRAGIRELRQHATAVMRRVHLATALSLGSELDAVVTHDRRMADAAATLGLAVTAPS